MRINQKLMKALKFIGAAAAFAIIVPFVGAKASAATEVGGFVVTGGTQGVDYIYYDSIGVLSICKNTPITIENKNKDTETYDTIEIEYNTDANITLAGVNIYTSKKHESAFEICDARSNVTITLADDTTNKLQSGEGYAGLQKKAGSGTLTIKGGLKGNGTLKAIGGYFGAGIGGRNGSTEKSSNIVIEGGIVTAQGGSSGAGIGGGELGSASDIKITGGSVKAIAGKNANAIGGGEEKGAVTPTNSDGKNVYLLELAAANSSLTIDDKVYPTNHGDNRVYVYLTEGEHTIEKDGDKKTVMLVKDLSGKLVEIGTAFIITATNGGTLVYGTDYTYPAKTGVLTIKSNKAITIANADPTTSTTDRIEVASGISANIILDGVNIDVSSGYNAAFKIADDSTGNVTITLADNSKNVLKSGQQCAGLQKNGSGISIGKLTIKGGANGTGSLEATGGYYGAGIGGGYGGNGKTITISGGTVTAKGGTDAAGIGGGAVFRNSTNGIGTGGEGENIIISGGSVNATGAHAIGGGSERSAVTPTNGSDDVYLCEIPNTKSENVTIDGTAYTPVNHAAVNPADTTLYAYLTGKDHTVTVGSTKNNCIFDNTTNTFKLTAVTTPSKPSGGNNRPTKPEITDYPIIDGKETTWKNIAKVISELEEGEEIEITLNGSTTVPADVIKAIKDSKAVAKIKITSAFSRTIDGSKLTDSDIMDYDFDIDLVTAKGTETLRGTVGTGFAIDDITDKAVLNIIFKSNHAGKFANLYKKVGEKLVFIDNAKIGSDGSVSGLAVYEKGEYVVMLGMLSDRAGDMNSDGILNAKDALAVLRHAAMLENGINPDVADMDGDKVITAKDALIILRKSAGLAG